LDSPDGTRRCRGSCESRFGPFIGSKIVLDTPDGTPR
jgi:hypothetical protein